MRGQKMTNQVNHSQSNNNPYRYEGQKSYDDRLCVEGEVLAPFVIKEENRMVRVMKINRDNLRTFKFGGKPVLVGFIPVQLEDFDVTMKVFNADVHEYLSRYTKGKLDTTSLEKMMETDDGKSNGYDPTAISSHEETMMLIETIEELIEEVYQRSPKHGKILRLIYGNYEITKQEIIARLGMKKTQGYEAIKKAQAMAKEVYRELNQ